MAGKFFIILFNIKNVYAWQMDKLSKNYCQNVEN